MDNIKEQLKNHIKPCLLADLLEFEKWLKYKGLSQNTIKNYFSDILQSMKFFSHNKQISLQELIQFDINKFRELLAHQQEKGHSNKTQERLIASWKKWAKFKCKNEEHENIRSVFAKIKYPKIQQKVATNIEIEEINKLLATQKVAKTWQELRNKALIILLYSSGIRINEAINLRWKDLSETYCKITGKGSKIRFVPILPAAKLALKEYKAALDEENEYVFTGQRAKKWHACSAERYFRQLVTQHNLQHITPHTLRHACASHLLKSGCSLRSIQALLGHKNLETTKIYIQHSIEDLKAAHKKALND